MVTALASVAAVALIAAVLVMLPDDSHPVNVTASASGAETATTMAQASQPTTSTAIDETTTSTSTSNTTPLVCRNSTDPACGPFSWDPTPDDQPMTLDVQLSSTTAKVGEDITVTVHAADPDASIASCPPPGFRAEESGDTFFGCGATLECYASPMYGPWDPPPPAPPSDQLWAYTVSFTTPGTKTIDLTFQSVSDVQLAKRCLDHVTDPYGSLETRRFTVEVS